MICCTRYVHNKLIKILRMHYGELIWKFKEHERKKNDGWWLYTKYSIRQD